MATLEGIAIKGFKSIKSVERLELNPINILIGPNGSGKSSFVEVFSFLRSIRTGRLQHYVETAGGANRILHFGARMTGELEIFVSFNEGTNQYEIRLVPTDDDSLFPEMETVYFWDKARFPRPYDEILSGSGGEARIADPNNRTGIARYIRDDLDTWRLYHFHDTSRVSPMKSTCNVNDNRFLRQDGSDLAAFLYFLYRRHGTDYDLIRRTIQLVAPFFDDFALAPLALNEDHSPSVAAPGFGRRFRRRGTLGWHPALHRLDHPFATAEGDSTLRHSPGRTRTRPAPLCHHHAGLPGQKGFSGDSSSDGHTVSLPARSF
jgi:predicted ATPase